MSTQEKDVSQRAQRAQSAPVAQQSAGTLCPACHEPVDSSSPTAPFCSARCRLVDLGKWFDEKYVISRDLKDADLDQGE